MSHRRIRTLLLGTFGALAGVVVLGVVLVYAASEWMLRRSYDAPLAPVPKATSPADLAEGERLARIVGCWAGCHGMEGEGDAESLPGFFYATAPPLPSVIPLYSDEELVRLIRYGVKRDGHTAIGMISGTFYPLSDQDLARIIGHLRRQPPLPPAHRERYVTFRGRLALLTGAWATSVGEVDRSSPRWGELPRATPYERGRYLASITCSECHGFDLRGEELEGSPSLAIVAAYSPEQFRHLMRTGEPINGIDLGLMSWVARNGFAHFTDEEIADLYSFLMAYHGITAPAP